MIDRNLETTLFDLLENYGLDNVMLALFRYADLQARLAKSLDQTEAAAKWREQAYEIGTMRL